MPKAYREYRLISSTTPRYFPVSAVMFRFPITSLWRDCRLDVTFKSPTSRALCDVPIRLPWCADGAAWGFHL